MATHTLVNSAKEKNMDKVIGKRVANQTQINIKEVTWKIKNMGMENSCGKQGAGIEGITSMMKRKAMARCNGLMEVFIVDFG
jgi:hypothetical protein